MKKNGCDNERTHMMMLARDVIGLMFHRHFPPSPDSSIPQELKERELSENEQELYNGAIDFLKAEFKKGPRPETKGDNLGGPG